MRRYMSLVAHYWGCWSWSLGLSGDLQISPWQNFPSYNWQVICGLGMQIHNGHNGLFPILHKTLKALSMLCAGWGGGTQASVCDDSFLHPFQRCRPGHKAATCIQQMVTGLHWTVEKLKIACPLTLKGCMLGNLRGSKTQVTILRGKSTGERPNCTYILINVKNM